MNRCYRRPSPATPPSAWSVGLHLRFLSADVRPRFNLSTYNLSGVAGSVGVFQQEGVDQRGASRDFTIRPKCLNAPRIIRSFLRFSIGSLHIF